MKFMGGIWVCPFWLDLNQCLVHFRFCFSNISNFSLLGKIWMDLPLGTCFLRFSGPFLLRVGLVGVPDSWGYCSGKRG